MMRTRLCLVTPSPVPMGFAETLGAALDSGDVASLLIDRTGLDAATVDELARIAAHREVAAIIIDGPASSEADGLHIQNGVDALRAARTALGDDAIVGAGGVGSRHDAMTLGELLPDYLFFGRIEEDNEPSIHPKALELAVWWANLFQIPAMVMAGSNLNSVSDAATNGVEFVALRRAVWDHSDGAARAVKDANALLDENAAQ